MFTRVEVRNFRSLRDVSVPLSNFHVLVGANGSGKTTFLDVFAFMGDILRGGLKPAVDLRASRWDELTFMQNGGSIKFAFEAQIPEPILLNGGSSDYDSIRYEISIYKDEVAGKLEIGHERCFLFHSQWSREELEYDALESDSTAQYWISNKFDKRDYLVIDRQDDGRTILKDESRKNVIGVFRFEFDQHSLALANVPEDLQKFPVITWLKNQFKDFLQPVEINSNAISKAGKEGRTGTVNPDGSNLPWLIDSLKKNYPDRYKLWFRHIQSDFPEIKSIKTVLREDQDDMFLKIKYKEGHEVKQWMVSDGTLRYLLLTIIPYLLDLEGLFLIEEPEIGLHPRAIQSVMDSLRSVYGGQVLVTTHSPETVNCAKKKELLIFSKNEAGETHIVSALEHLYFKDWKGDLGSGAFYGPGVMI
jgi:predicted ATPase